MTNNMNIQPLPLYSGAPNSIQGGVLMPPGYTQQIPNMANYAPGKYSQMAYQMAGSPVMGPWAASTPPPLQPYSTGGLNNSGSSGAASAVGLLNDANKARNLYNNVTGLLNPGVSQSDLASLYAQSAPTADAVQPLVTTPAQAGVGDVSGPLYPGAANANADLAAQEANAYAANGGLLGGSATDAGALGLSGAAASQGIGSAAAGALADSTPYVAATTGEAPTGLAAYGASDAAAGDTAAASGSGVGVAGPLIGAGILYQLEQGLTSPGFSSSTGTAINDSLGNFTGTVAPWLNSAGPGLAYMSGDGSSAHPLTAVLKNGTQLNQDQMNQLQSLYQKGYLQANPNTYSTHSDAADHPINMNLPSDITAQMNQILGQATPATPWQGLSSTELAAMQQAQQIAQQARSGTYPSGVFGG
jgi:hypothetical protein